MCWIIHRKLSLINEHNDKLILRQQMSHLLIMVKQNTFNRCLLLHNWLKFVAVLVAFCFSEAISTSKLHVCFLNWEMKRLSTETTVWIEVSCSLQSTGSFILIRLLVLQDPYCKHCYLKGGSLCSGSFRKCCSVSKDWENRIPVF